MAHQNEKPPEGGEERRLEALSSDLANQIFAAMSAWADKHETFVDARLPLAAMLKVTLQCLGQLSPALQRTYAEDFARALRKHTRQ